jgi:hypothetical protein
MTLEELRTRNFATVAEAVEAVFDGKLDERTLRRAIDEGQIPAIKVGTKTLIPVAPLLAMLDAPDRPAVEVQAPAAEPAADALAAVREILRGALRALDVLTGYHGEDHGAAEQSVNAGQHDATLGLPVLPHLLRGGGNVA